MKQKESMNKQTNSKSANQTHLKVCELHSKEFGTLKVTNDKNCEGYVCLNDLCSILNLQKEQEMVILDGHRYTAIPVYTKGTEQPLDFVDEFGVYMLFILSEAKDAIRVQEFLEEEFLAPLHEQKMNQMGLDKDAVIISDSAFEIQAIKYLATAENVRKSGHFKVAKDIPEQTMSHLIGWWYNPNDTSTFMLQFDRKSHCLVYQNVRMNVYLTKMRDGSTDQCRMTISFLDLDDDNSKFFAIDTYLPSYVLSENAILDYIFAAHFQPVELVESGNQERVMILNGTMSFHRSRRV